MKFRNGSGWSVENEIKCLILFKKLEAENFPRGKQSACSFKFCRASKLRFSSITAKISNYKSEAGINRPSKSSSATKELYKKYGNLTIKELEDRLEKIVAEAKPNKTNHRKNNK